MNHLSSITHDIHKSFDGRQKIRGFFLDISKAFEKVWHEGLFYRPKQNDVSGDFLKLVTDFIYHRK